MVSTRPLRLPPVPALLAAASLLALATLAAPPAMSAVGDTAGFFGTVSTGTAQPSQSRPAHAPA